MKCNENKDVELFWGYLQPFCSTFFSQITLFSIFNFTFCWSAHYDFWGQRVKQFLSKVYP